MNQFPLSPFLIKLRDDNIRVTVRDYERIKLALNTGGEWTRSRLRDVLLCLLVSDWEQEEAFLRRFDAFFPPVPYDKKFLEGIDVGKCLADLKILGKRHAVDTPPLVPKVLRTRVTRRTGTNTSQSKKTITVALTVAASLAIIVFLAIACIIWNTPVASLSDSRLGFDLETGNKKADTKTVVVRNQGRSNLVVNRIEISGKNPEVFLLSEFIPDRQMSTGKTLEIPVTFSPQDVIGKYAATLLVHDNTENSPHVVELTGSVKDGKVKAGTEVEISNGPDVALPGNRKYRNVLFAGNKPEYVQFGIPKDWLIYLGLALLFLTGTSIFALYIIRSRKIPEDEKPYWNEDEKSPRHFSTGTIGGKPCRRIDDHTLDQLADSMGYFKSEQEGRILDIDASISATGERGGVPSLRFHNLRRIRSLIILEDAFSQPLAWNPTARELAEGMERRGTPVIYGKICGAVGEFMADDGSLLRLEDLEDSRHGYLILIFTDGKSLCGNEAVFDLETLAHWPMVAWMELRELRSWDKSSSLPVRYGIPIYPATQEGVLKAVTNFLTEQACRDNYSVYAVSPRGFPAKAGVNFDAFLEQFLGGALTWAQDCAMIQPISPGLADSLRRGFHNQLPPESMERLYTIPGTNTSVSGLKFSDNVLKVLRNGFITRRSDGEQKEVLQHILKEVEHGMPAEEDSISYLKWECMRERIYMELDPDYDLKRLGQLSKTPLSNHISAGFDNFGFPEEKGRIPLRHKPRNKYALQRLVKMSEKFPVSKLEAFPVEWWKWCCQGTLAALFIFFTFTCIVHYNELHHYIYITLDNKEVPDDTFVWIETKIGSTMKPYLKGYVGEVQDKSLKSGERYRLSWFYHGYMDKQEFYMKRGHNVKIFLNLNDRERPCTDESPDIGLYTAFCSGSHREGKGAHGSSSWRNRLGNKAAEDRVMSIGLEITDKDVRVLSDLGNSLLETGSVDVLYRITVGADNDWHTEEAVKKIADDLGPCMYESQLICWRSISGDRIVLPSDVLERFGRVLSLGNDVAVRDIIALYELVKYTRSEDNIITEDLISEAMKTAELRGSGSQLKLISFTRQILVKGSCFDMGDTLGSENDGSDEKPVHKVCVDDFYLDEHEVTQGEWKFIMGSDNNPSGFSECGDDCPVEQVSWNDIQNFIGKLREKTSLEYRLPTEAEWEFAARGGGKKILYAGFSDSDRPDQYANFCDTNCGNSWKTDDYDDGYKNSAPVKSYLPNGLELYDMSGNVWEWVHDWYDSEYYSKSPKNNPKGPEDGSDRVIRGGSWDYEHRDLRASNRFDDWPDYGYDDVGFRLARTH
ncbi:MAG: SUMF1/EgtB/PvdO family nonheme iron enzyme [Planctomycetes bacterium]|nr:SUMF1/EgtB/PvdO family nonheme iron enzyme [Planctomycetota bacterium]